MHRTDDSKYLLYIEPMKEEKSKSPVNDRITEAMSIAVLNAKPGAGMYSDLKNKGQFVEAAAWRGWHTTNCGKISDNKDYLLPNGMITNSLCLYYLQYYRDSIPDSEMEKVEQLVKYIEQNF